MPSLHGTRGEEIDERATNDGARAYLQNDGPPLAALPFSAQSDAKMSFYATGGCVTDMNLSVATNSVVRYVPSRTFLIAKSARATVGGSATSCRQKRNESREGERSRLDLPSHRIRRSARTVRQKSKTARTTGGSRSRRKYEIKGWTRKSLKKRKRRAVRIW